MQDWAPANQIVCRALARFQTLQDVFKDQLCGEDAATPEMFLSSFGGCINSVDNQSLENTKTKSKLSEKLFGLALIAVDNKTGFQLVCDSTVSDPIGSSLFSFSVGFDYTERIVQYGHKLVQVGCPDFAHILLQVFGSRCGIAGLEQDINQKQLDMKVLSIV